jgi:hypothetical protein
MNKLTLLIVLLFGCEFRPPSYEFKFDYENTKCIHPINEIHFYNNKFSEIIECVYDYKDRVSQENVFLEDSLDLSKMIIYNYYKTYYEKIIFDYNNGDKDHYYIVDRQYISTE